MELSERQQMVLRAVVTAYVGEALPVGSATLSHLLPVALSSASVRNTMAELTSLGLIEKPHPSAGRVPTERGLRVFVEELLDPHRLGRYEMRDLADSLELEEAGDVVRVASKLLSERTRQLGFVMTPRLEHVALEHVSLVRLTSRRLLVVLVSRSGAATQRIVADDGRADQAELDRMTVVLNERVRGLTLQQLRDRLAREARSLRSQADRLLARVLAQATEDAELVVASWLALLDQPEFHDLDRVRQVLETLQTQERLMEILDELLPGDAGLRVRVAFGEEIGEPGLRHCALVAAPYGREGAPLGVLGVIGPSRMDFARVIPLVGYLSTLVTEKFCE